MSADLRVELKVHLHRGRQSELRPGEEPTKPPAGRVPRLAKLMALAIRFDQLIRDGHVEDLAEIARLGHVTRARVTQIMNLLNLAPDIQEEILFLPEVTKGRDPITERDVRPIVRLHDWAEQRRAWEKLRVRVTDV